jgi:RNA polymerase sigma-B factor
MSTLVTDELKTKSLELFQQYQATANPAIRNQIIKINLGLVRKEAHYWGNQCHETFEDLVQIGCIGLLRAVERFDPDKGNAFSSFAIPYIRGEIQHYLRDKSSPVKIPRQWLTIQRQALKIRQNFRDEFKRTPTELEIAQRLNISVLEWEEIKLACKNREPLSLDIPISNNEQEGQSCLGDLVPDPHYKSFQLAQEDQIRLQMALGELEEKTRYILEFVFLQDLTQKETAERLGISIITVSRHLKKGIQLLQKMMGKENN